MPLNLYKLHSNPELLDGYHEAHEKVPAAIWEKYKNNPEELKKREALIAQDAEVAVLYAWIVLKRPFLAGEPAIAKDVKYAYLYAQEVLDGPFPAGEPTIAGQPKVAYWYATEVLKGKNVPKIILDAIKSNPVTSKKYQQDVLKGQSLPG